MCIFAFFSKMFFCVCSVSVWVASLFLLISVPVLRLYPLWYYGDWFRDMVRFLWTAWYGGFVVVNLLVSTTCVTAAIKHSLGEVFLEKQKNGVCALRAFLLKMLLCFCVFFAPSPVVCCGGRKAWPGPEDPHKNSQKPVFNFWKLALARWSFCAPNVVFACIFGQFVPRSEMHCF